MKFVALDVETANPDMASICQIGIARYEGGALIDEWSSYVDPEDYFDSINVSIHGIDEDTVRGSPSFAEIAPKLYQQIEGSIVISHGHFDRTAISRTAERYQIAQPEARWLDTASIARRTWRRDEIDSYSLKSVCRVLGYDFHHHDALADAKAAGQILLHVLHEGKLDIEGWLKRIHQPVDFTTQRAQDGDPNGPLYGETLVFTGVLELARSDAIRVATAAGCRVATSVTRKTTILVVGDQDVDRIGGSEKSVKHRKAEELIAAGIPLRILKEADFHALLSAAVQS